MHPLSTVFRSTTSRVRTVQSLPKRAPFLCVQKRMAMASNNESSTAAAAPQLESLGLSDTGPKTAPESTTRPDSTPTPPPLRYIDIGINLSDPVFSGKYHSKQHHPSDLADIIARARAVGCDKLMVTGSDLHESQVAIDLATTYPGVCYATVGVHPCSGKQFYKPAAGGPDAYLHKLRELAIDGFRAGKVAAFGEIGLDYDRLEWCGREMQLETFEKQLDLVVELGGGKALGPREWKCWDGKSSEAAPRPTTPSTSSSSSSPPLPFTPPLFLHCRAAVDDFIGLLTPRLPFLPNRGLVHSFTGSVDEMRRLVQLGFDIGVNGCSMKTDENLAVVRAIPLDRLQIETDGPWCEIRNSHASAKYLPGRTPEEKPGKKPGKQRVGQDKGASSDVLASSASEPAVDADGDPLPPALPAAVKKERWAPGAMVKGRNEPATIPQVAYVIAKVKGVSVYEVAQRARENSVRMFGLGEAVLKAAPA